LAAFLIALPVAWMFGRPAIEDRWLAFRDAANYYQPLFAWESEEWAAGRIPLWNPGDNCGTPAIADATSSVFYPGKAVFLLPLNFELRFHLYLVLHVLLAAGGAYWLARGWNCSRQAAALAAIAYSLGGNVLFQTCNVVFLVGAAWLPLAALATDRLLRQRSQAAAIGLGVVLALMTLGGDPQIAYHVLLGAVLYWAVLICIERGPSVPDTPAAALQPRGTLASYRIVLLSMAAGSGFLLAAVQILPSLVWTAASDRASFEQPRNLTEFVERSFADDTDITTMSRDKPDVSSAIWGVPQAGTHHAHSYQFSVAPWRLIEYIWPNLYGSPYPKNRRWISALPGEGRVWTPSMYLGLLPLVLALGCFRLRAICPRQRWLSWSLLLAVLASFGWYGIGWVIHEFRCGLGDASTDDFLVGPQVGGLYWLMSSVLPGYVYFRFPAKLMVIASLAASLLAAIGWDKAWQAPTRLPRILLGLGSVSFAMAAAAWLLRIPFDTWVANAPVNQIFGPLDSAGAFAGMLRALLHTSLLCFALSAFFRHATAAPTSPRAAMFRRLALVATVCEIVLANNSLLVTIPGKTLRDPAHLAREIHAHADSRGITVTPRVYRDAATKTPRRWRGMVAADRLNEVVSWERDTLLPKHHLTNDIALIESFSTLSSRDFRIFMRVARESGTPPNGAPNGPNLEVLNLLSAQYFVLPRAERSDRTSSSVAEVKEPQLVPVHNPNSFPRGWIVHRAHVLPPLSSKDPRILRQRTRDVLFEQEKPRDFSTDAVVETGDLRLLDELVAARSSPAKGHEQESCREISRTPHRVEFRCQLREPGLVVVNDLFYPGWRAYVRQPHRTRGHEVPIFRTNRVMRSVYLPAGDHILEMVYRPTDFYAGATISVVGWVLLVIAASFWFTIWKLRLAPPS
jgi:hypothetical protein